jgi:hypothetical protein
MSNTEIDLEIGIIDKRVVLHIKYKHPDIRPVLIGLKGDELSNFIQTLQQAQKQIQEMPDD